MNAGFFFHDYGMIQREFERNRKLRVYLYIVRTDDMRFKFYEYSSVPDNTIDYLEDRYFISIDTSDVYYSEYFIGRITIVASILS